MKLLEFAEKLAALKSDPASPSNDDPIQVIEAGSAQTFTIVQIHVEDMEDGSMTVWIEVDAD